MIPLLIFRGFLPVVVNFLRRVPIIGNILNMPGISSVSSYVVNSVRSKCLIIQLSLFLKFKVYQDKKVVNAEHLSCLNPHFQLKDGWLYSSKFASFYISCVAYFLVAGA